MDISSASEDAKHGEVGFAAIEGLVGCHTVEGGMGSGVLDANKEGECHPLQTNQRERARAAYVRTYVAIWRTTTKRKMSTISLDRLELEEFALLPLVCHSALLHHHHLPPFISLLPILRLPPHLPHNSNSHQLPVKTLVATVKYLPSIGTTSHRLTLEATTILHRPKGVKTLDQATVMTTRKATPLKLFVVQWRSSIQTRST